MPKLSLALHKYDVTTAELIGEIKMGLDKTHPILGQIQVYSVVHGGTTRQVSEPQIVDTDMKEYSTNSILHFDCFLKTDVERFTELVYEMWETFALQATKVLFDTVSLTSEAVGNVYDAAGRNIWDAQIEMIESLEMHFDEEGEHNYQLYVHPETAKKLAANPPTPEQEKKIEDLIGRKREEYYAKKRTRRLS